MGAGLGTDFAAFGGIEARVAPGAHIAAHAGGAPIPALVAAAVSTQPGDGEPCSLFIVGVSR